MIIKNFLQESKKFEIESYKRPKDYRSLSQTHVPFSGSPQKHPYDLKKIILVTDPYCPNTFYYEFKTDDISYIEELPNIVNPDGKTITMARIWIKKRSIGVRCSPFQVEDIGPTVC